MECPTVTHAQFSWHDDLSITDNIVIYHIFSKNSRSPKQPIDKQMPFAWGIRWPIKSATKAEKAV